ncbi:MAG: RNA polymerase sigma factor [Planctomycetota bacterium]
MGRYDHTEMGGPNEAFETTPWTDLLRARTLDPDRRRAVVNQLLKRYWKPVYAYLRRKGKNNEEAKDLTQGFFEEIVLGRDLIQQADRRKGKFRTLLLTALDRYVTSAHRARTAQKRRPAEGLVSLDGVEGHRVPEPADNATPEQAFHCAWASALLDAVLDELRESYVGTGRAAYWEVFRTRTLDPILHGAEPVPLPDLCARLGIRDPARASNMLVTAKRRFRSILRSHVARFVEDEDDIDREIDELIEILSRAGHIAREDRRE